MRNRFVLALAVSFFFALGVRGLVAVSPGPEPTPDANPKGNTGALKGRIETGGGYDAHSGNASRFGDRPPRAGGAGRLRARFYASLEFGAAGGGPGTRGVAVGFWGLRLGTFLGMECRGRPGRAGGRKRVRRNLGDDNCHHFPDGHANVYKISRSSWYHGQPWWNLHPGPWHGAPYYAEEGAQNWPSPGESVRDWLGGMVEDGHEFWLYLADGGAVHFEGYNPAYGSSGYAHWKYKATEVFDPHGFKTDLIYENNRLKEVRQEGGRSLILTWATFLGSTRTLITRVETQGSAGGQGVSYKYTRFPNSSGSLLTLAKVTYEDDPAPGQTTSAVYTYSESPPSAFPILTKADDPRFAGPMTKIAYAYRGTECFRWLHPVVPAYFNVLFDYFLAKPEAIAIEYSGETLVPVCRFDIGCFDGTRTEYNGFSAFRKFYFGRSASNGVAPAPYHIKGYQLAKVTDYTYQKPLPAGLPFQHQNYTGGTASRSLGWPRVEERPDRRSGRQPGAGGDPPSRWERGILQSL